MKKFSTTAAAAAIVALVSLPAAAQQGSGATDQAGSQPGSSAGSTGGATAGDDSTAGTTAGTSGTLPQSDAAGTSAKDKDKDKAASHDASAVSGSTKAFLTEAAEGGMAEVDLGKLATEKASNEDVKKFGQMMVDDHSKANDTLKAIAQKKNVTVPSDLSAKHKSTHDKLAKLSGEAFDHAYMRDMVADHTKDVAAFKKQSASATDPDVKQFAGDTLPTLEKHLQDAKDISQKLGGKSMTSGETGKHEHKAKGTSGTSPTPGTGTGTTPSSAPPTP